MAGRKRAATDDASTEKRETRSAKVAKTEGFKSAGKAAKGTARLKASSNIPFKPLASDYLRGRLFVKQTSMAASAFKSRAVPLHVNITTTAPALEGQEPATPADPGFLASTTLVPSTFATGSYGWKGNKRIVVELPKAEGEEGEGEKVHVMLTINATVIGSKNVKEGEEPAAEKEGEEEPSGEAPESKPGESPEVEVKEGEDQPPASEEQVEESAM